MTSRILAVLIACAASLVARGAAAESCVASNPATGYTCWSWTTNAFASSATQWRDAAGELELNYVYVPPSPDLARDGQRTLLLVLPGTGMSPGAYKGFMAEAALRGYYVIGLAYRNQIDAPDLCGYWASCAGYLYQQHVTGELHGFYGADMLVGITPGANSINYRLGMFLTWLNLNRIGGIDWSEFWDRSAPYTTAEGFGFNGQPWWSRIVVAGHGQGGEIATWLTKTKPVIAGLAFSAPYSNLDNDHRAVFLGDTTPNGAPHHMKKLNGTWVDATSEVTHWAPFGGTVSDAAFPSYLDPATWPAGRLDRLFITLDAYDKGYDLGQAHNQSWPGHNLSGAVQYLGKAQTVIAAPPAQLVTRVHTIDWDSPTCSSHNAPLVDGCTPPWIRGYWQLLLDRALTLP